MKILVAGSAGFIGSALVPSLETGGHTITRLVRLTPVPETQEVFWDPARGEIDEAGLEGIDAVVHLAGANPSGGQTGLTYSAPSEISISGG